MRQKQYGEMVWLYSLPQDRFPLFSPCIDGISQKTPAIMMTFNI
jgi:hypothetical protein